MSVAVGRFVAVGEAIATENQELKDEMGQACFEARRAGSSHFTELQHLNFTTLSSVSLLEETVKSVVIILCCENMRDLHPICSFIAFRVQTISSCPKISHGFIETLLMALLMR